MNRLDKLLSGGITKSAWDTIFLKNLQIEPGEDVLKKPYSKSDLVFVCVSTTARAISQVPLRVSMRRGSDWNWADSRHPVQQLLSKPNINTNSMEEFISAIISYLLLDGHSFVVPFPPGRSMQSLWVVKREFMSPVINERTGQLEFWSYKPQQKALLLLPEEVGSIKFFNPDHQYLGMAPLEAGKLPLLNDYKASNYTNKFWDQGAVPGGVLTSEKNLTPERIEILRKGFLSEHEGYKKSHRIAVLEGGLKYQQIGLNQKDMEFISLRKYSRDQILQIFGMKKAVISVVEDLNYATAKEERKEWWQDTNLPLMKLVEASLTNILFGDNSQDIKVIFDISGVEALHEDFIKRVEIADILHKIGFTGNEINERLELGFGKKNWRDKWYMPVNTLPVSEQGIEPLPTPGGSTPPPSGPTPLPGPSNTPPRLPEPPKSVDVGVIEGVQVRDAVEVLAEDDPHLKAWQKLISKTEPLEEEFLSKVRRCFFDMRKRALKLLNQKSPKDVLEENFLEEQANLMKWTVPIYTDAAKAGAHTLAAEIGMGVSFNINDPEVLDFLTSRPLKVRHVVTTIKNQIAVDIQTGMAQNETINQIAARIRNNFSNATRRAMTIARTEVGSAANFGRNKEMREAGFTKKIWVTAQDEVVRKSHIAMHGHSQETGKPWIVGGASLRFPGDPNGPGREVINCRCIEVVDPESRSGKPKLDLETLLGNEGELFDISNYPLDFKEISAIDLGRQANLRDTAAIINGDLKEYQSGTFKPNEVDIKEGFSKKNVDIISANMKFQARMFREYLAPDTQLLLQDYIHYYTGLAEKLNPARINVDTVNRLGLDSVRKLVMQEIESNRQQFTDHGIRHLVGNIKRQSEYLGLIQKELGPGGDPVFDHFMAQFIMINHDIGYTTPLVRAGGFRGVMASSKHKWWSEKILAEQKDLWDVGKIFSEAEYKRILNIVASHDATDLSLDDILAFTTRLSDNTSLYAKEKLPAAFKNVPNGEQILMDMHAAMDQKDMAAFTKARDALNKAIDDAPDINPFLKRDMKAGVQQLSIQSPKFTSGVLGGDISEIYSSAKSVITIDVQHNAWNEYMAKFFDFGQRQLVKLMDDYGAKFEDNVLTLGKLGGKNLIEIRVLNAPIPTRNKYVKEFLQEHPQPTLVRQYAAQYGLTLEEAAEQIQNNIQYLVDRCDIWVRRGDRGIKGLMDDKRMKTQFETGTSSGAFDPYLRRGLEDLVTGINPLEDINRPVYGYLTNSKTGGLDQDDGLKQYGTWAAKLKPKTKSFATWTWGDSMDMNVMAHIVCPEDLLIKIANHQELTPAQITRLKQSILPGVNTFASPLQKIDLSVLHNASGMAFDDDVDLDAFLEAIRKRDVDKFIKSNRYIEVQIHGGVTAADVAELWTNEQAKFDALKDQLKDALPSIKIRSTQKEVWRTKRKMALEDIVESDIKSPGAKEIVSKRIEKFLKISCSDEVIKRYRETGGTESISYEPRVRISYGSGKVMVSIDHRLASGGVSLSAGPDVGSTEFTLHTGHDKYLYHDYYVMKEGFRKLGISTNVMDMADSIAVKKFGMTEEHLSPAWSGRYVWPGKFGYELDCSPGKKQDIISAVKAVGEKHGIDIKDEHDFIRLKSEWDVGELAHMSIPGYKKKIELKILKPMPDPFKISRWTGEDEDKFIVGGDVVGAHKKLQDVVGSKTKVTLRIGTPDPLKQTSADYYNADSIKALSDRMQQFKKYEEVNRLLRTSPIKELVLAEKGYLDDLSGKAIDGTWFGAYEKKGRTGKLHIAMGREHGVSPTALGDFGLAKTSTDTFTHEFGHHIYRQLIESNRETAEALRQLWKADHFGESISEYARTNESEYFAECFLAYTGKWKKDMPKNIRDFMSIVLGKKTKEEFYAG